MDFFMYSGDRSTMPAEAVLRENFGSVDTELASLLGYVSMMSALIEMKVADIAMSVDTELQNFYMHSLVGKNHDVWKARSPLYDQTEFECETVAFTTAAIKSARIVLDERNELLHRVWSQAAKASWGGYKGVKTQKPQIGATAKSKPDPILWREYSREDFDELIRRMGVCVDTLQSAVGRVTSFDRTRKSVKS